MTSDTDLRIEVRSEIARQRGDRAGDIDVHILAGVVTLSGNVQSDPERWNLRDAIIDMAGVARVIDETMIVPGPSLQSPDADVARPWFPKG